jgi:hypothetical protein
MILLRWKPYETENYIAGQKHNIYEKVSTVTELWKSLDRQKKWDLLGLYFTK